MKLEANKNSTSSPNIELVEQALKTARPWGLEAEVMWSALNAGPFAREHGLTLEEVLEEALDNCGIGGTSQ